MLISQQFVVNKLKALGIHIPDEPSAINDSSLNRFVVIAWQHFSKYPFTLIIL
jgi:hypothetical protein